MKLIIEIVNGIANITVDGIDGYTDIGTPDVVTKEAKEHDGYVNAIDVYREEISELKDEISKLKARNEELERHLTHGVKAKSFEEAKAHDLARTGLVAPGAQKPDFDKLYEEGKKAVADLVSEPKVWPYYDGVTADTLQKAMIMRAMKLPYGLPDHNGFMPPGTWKLTQEQMHKVTRLTLIQYLGGWVVRLSPIEQTANGDETLYVVHVPDNMPKTGNLTAYLRTKLGDKADKPVETKPAQD